MDTILNLKRAEEIRVLKSFRLKHTEYHDLYTDAHDFQRFYTKTYTSEKFPDYIIEMLNEPWGIDRNPPTLKLYKNSVLIHVEYRKGENIYNIAKIIIGG